MIEEIENLEAEIETTEIDDSSGLEEFLLKSLSPKGQMRSPVAKIGSVPPEERATVGKRMNQLKKLAESRYEESKAAVENREDRQFLPAEDITLPVQPAYRGSLHPLTQTLDEMKQIFLRLGRSEEHT